MSYEAVPCMFRSSSQDGNGEQQYLGLLIRPSGSTQNGQAPPSTSAISGRAIGTQPVVSMASGVAGSSKTPQPLLVQGVYPQGAPIVVNGDTPKVLVPTKVQVRLQGSSGDASVAISTSPLSSSTIPTTAIPWQTSQHAQAKGLSSLTGTFASPAHSQPLPSPCSSQPRSLSVCSASPLTDSSPMSPLPSVLPYQHHQAPLSTIRPGLQADPRGPIAGKMPTSAHWTLPVSDSSTTPDSGIQSVPGSPPSNHPLTPPTIQLEACGSVCEDRIETEEDFADMPRLLPADQEDNAVCSTSASCSSFREDVSSAHGSECETAPTPSISITPSMDSNEIVEQLLQLDPEKASAIANLIRKKTQLKRRSGSRQESTPKRFRPESAASEELRKSDEEIKVLVVAGAKAQNTATKTQRDSENSVKSEVLPKEDSSNSNSASRDINDCRKTYREAVKRMLRAKVAALVDATAHDIQDLHIGLRERHDRRGSKDRRKIWTVDWEQVKKRRRKEDERKKMTEKKKREESMKSINRKHDDKKTSETCLKKKETAEKCKKRSSGSLDKGEGRESRNSRINARAFNKRPETGREDLIDNKVEDYEEISRSIPYGSLPEWECPVLSCGCARGACTSDAECVNRALCVQCPPGCAAPLCANKKFWKDDSVKQLIASGSRNKRILRTKQARRAGDFLCEYAGEVVSYLEAVRRYEQYSESDIQPLMLCLTSKLFVDTTVKGNISRYVRHSCRPNARLEVWCVNGTYRAGLFSLVDIASGIEITINMSGLLLNNQECKCGATACRGLLKRSRNATIAGALDLSIQEERNVRSKRLFLVRNRQQTIERATICSLGSKSSNVTPGTLSSLRVVLKGLSHRIRRVDGSLPYEAVAGYSRVVKILHAAERVKAVSNETLNSFHLAIRQWLDEMDDDDYDRVYTSLRTRYLVDHEKIVEKAEDKAKKDKKKEGKFINQDTNLSYIDSNYPVGSYDPDAAWPAGPANEGDDAVRCICGSLEEDGEMMQCDSCHFWLHSECLGQVDQSTEYTCNFCTGTIKGGRPSTDVVLGKQPDIRLDGCKYYKALINRRSIQVRLNETVHVEKTIGDDHKKILKRLFENSEKKKKGGKDEKFKILLPPTKPGKLERKEFERKDLRIFRVERLFAASGGHRFVFGFYYARPHETFCDSQRIFHRSEVFATPLYDTLPLDAVVGRCAVLDPSVWCKGRPTVPEFKEADVYICEYQIDRNQRSFEKIPPKNRYPINTQPYVFRNFVEPLTLKRDFTPFIVEPSPASIRLNHKSDSVATGLDLRSIALSNLFIVIDKISKYRQADHTLEKRRRK